MGLVGVIAICWRNRSWKPCSIRSRNLVAIDLKEPLRRPNSDWSPCTSKHTATSEYEVRATQEEPKVVDLAMTFEALCHFDPWMPDDDVDSAPGYISIERSARQNIEDGGVPNSQACFITLGDGVTLDTSLSLETQSSQVNVYAQDTLLGYALPHRPFQLTRESLDEGHDIFMYISIGGSARQNIAGEIFDLLERAIVGGIA